MGRDRQGTIVSVVTIFSGILIASAHAAVGIEGDIASLDASDQNIAFVLDYNGSDNIYVSLVVDPFTGKFAGGRFGHGNDIAGWNGMTGGLSTFGFADVDRFFTAHMAVDVDFNTGKVRLQLTNLDGNPNRSLTEIRGGWVNTPGGSDMGFGGDGGKIALDNIKFLDSGVCDAFDRDNGDIGRLWNVVKPDAFIQGKTARANHAAIAIWVSEDCGACSGVEKLSANCKARTSGNLIIAKVTKGLPGGLVQFTLQGGPPTEEKTISNKGKAKMKWADVSSGLHFVFAGFSCGYTLEARPTCP